MNRYLAILKIIVVLLFISGTINAQNADPHQNIGSEITGLPTEKVLLILDISVHDLLQYEKYQMQLEPIVKAHGGTYLVRSSGKTFDDVVVKNIFTTDMSKFLEVAAYRAEIYKNHFPTGSWLGVRELALPEFLIEIELEVHQTEN